MVFCRCECHAAMQLVLGRLAATQSAKPLTLSLLVDQPFFTDLVVPENFGRPGSAAGAAALNPAMPRRVVVAAKHSFSYPGARPCRRPSPKILQPAGVFTFLGVRGGKKEGKIWRCVLEVLVGRFLVDFSPIFIIFWYCPRVKIV